MCTLALAWRVYDDAPIVAAANRDEALGRPSTPPAVTGDDPRVLAPRDEEAGGTWTGVTDTGLYVAVTNRWSDLTGERSRGLLVDDALRAGDAAAARDTVEREVAARDYAGFNLVVADAEDAFLLRWDGDLTSEALSPGVHVATTTGAPDAEGRKCRVHEALTDRRPRTAAGFRGRAKRVLANHDVRACLHGHGYGTRSSTIVTVGRRGSRYEFADGPPCRTPYRDAGGFARE
ncbi:NRDE family protein [Halarchaeum sp. P4]|uniref:NRDE family protein n=1 Tax=Halarchaeum sp. P4 TaxID=3421639 RepID=UPI003EBE72BA